MFAVSLTLNVLFQCISTLVSRLSSLRMGEPGRRLRSVSLQSPLCWLQVHPHALQAVATSIHDVDKM